MRYEYDKKSYLKILLFCAVIYFPASVIMSIADKHNPMVHGFILVGAILLVMVIRDYPSRKRKYIIVDNEHLFLGQFIAPLTFYGMQKRTIATFDYDLNYADIKKMSAFIIPHIGVSSVMIWFDLYGKRRKLKIQNEFGDRDVLMQVIQSIKRNSTEVEISDRLKKYLERCYKNE